MNQQRPSVDKDVLASALSEIAAFLAVPVVVEREVAGVASPSHFAVDAAVRILRGDPDGPGFILKTWYDDCLAPVDVDNVFEMTLAASMIGATPAPRLRLNTSNSMLVDVPEGDWHTARLHEISAENDLHRLVELKRSLHQLPSFPVDRDVFADIEHLSATVESLALSLPDTMVEALDFARECGRAISASGVDRVPGHADGVTSNILISSDGNMKLVDFDEAGNVDPLFDLALVLNEVHPLDRAIQQSVIEAFEGSVSETSRARICAYQLADDLKWALWGLGMDRMSSRRNVEFLKYGQWRWLRARVALASMERNEVLKNV
ncbi:MAG TPA: hypothetical protein DEB63_09815 [Agrobacterium sp.]|jgi:thiamine kinase-like enzyme|uniref:phosphotransferase family protein n=1 Tax=unclassified Rhizobium TaxID=2613769 RepID=UPI000713865C|nr:phosphotransferase [Rhizobium sp. Root651]KRA60491.1 hypothetical protein ASD85_10120 [Rhizobium sp. Root651]HBT68470.1 hypothetical protein [Agrobacterium sp.]